jgi:hypothetical protein
MSTLPTSFAEVFNPPPKPVGSAEPKKERKPDVFDKLLAEYPLTLVAFGIGVVLTVLLKTQLYAVLGAMAMICIIAFLEMKFGHKVKL